MKMMGVCFRPLRWLSRETRLLWALSAAKGRAFETVAFCFLCLGILHLHIQACLYPILFYSKFLLPFRVIHNIHAIFSFRTLNAQCSIPSHPDPSTTNLDRYYMQGEWRTPGLSCQPHIYSPTNKRAINHLERTLVKDRKRASVTSQGPGNIFTNHLDVIRFIDNGLGVEENSPAFVSGEDGRDSSRELILKRAIGVDVEGGEA